MKTTIEFNPFKNNVYKGVQYEKITAEEVVMSCTVTPEELFSEELGLYCVRAAQNYLRTAPVKQLSFLIKVEGMTND